MDDNKTGLELAYSEYVEWSNARNKKWHEEAQEFRKKKKFRVQGVRAKYEKTMYLKDFVKELLTDDKFHSWWNRDCTVELAYVQRIEALNKKRIEEAKANGQVFVSPGIWANDRGPSDEYLASEGIYTRALKEKSILGDKPITKDGFYACTLCRGMKITARGACPACSIEEDGNYRSTGLRVSELERESTMERLNHEQTKKHYRWLQDSVKKKSTCSKCGGDQNKTPGGTPCDECGIVGMAPWGG